MASPDLSQREKPSGSYPDLDASLQYRILMALLEIAEDKEAESEDRVAAAEIAMGEAKRLAKKNKT